jgi:hypothetical protein
LHWLTLGLLSSHRTVGALRERLLLWRILMNRSIDGYKSDLTRLVYADLNVAARRPFGFKQQLVELAVIIYGLS